MKQEYFIIHFQRYYVHHEWGADQLLVKAYSLEDAIRKVKTKFKEAKDFENKSIYLE